MHIAIEGLDGAGKTSVSKLLAEELKFEFHECPIYDLVGRDGVSIFFEKLSDMDSSLQADIAALIFGAGNLYLKKIKQGKNVVTDRHLCSTYLFNSNKTNKHIFDFLVKTSGQPDLTVILYATPEVRRERIIARNPNDSDLNRDIFTDDKYTKAEEFVKLYNMNYFFLDNSNLDISQTVEAIKKELIKI